MTQPPPQDPADLATKLDLDALEEHLEVHLSVFVDERLTGTERRLMAAFQAELDTHLRAVAAAIVGAVLAAVIVALAVVGLTIR